jgi:tetratricopeptide (TPR) repeat protein
MDSDSEFDVHLKQIVEEDVMKGRILIAVLILGVLGVAAFLAYFRLHEEAGEARHSGKEEQKEPSAAAGGELPADEKAFYATYRITDTERRFEALEKFISDYPNSSQIGSARREIFKAEVKLWPEDRKKIMAEAERIIGPPVESGKRNMDSRSNYQFLAGELLAAGIWLDAAEEFALRSLDDFTRETYIEHQRKSYAEGKRTLPPDEVLNTRYLTTLAEYRTTLGRIYLKRGKPEAGEKILKEAYDAFPALAAAATGLAEIAEGKGDDAAALDYLTTAALTAGYKMAEARGKIEALYRKTHGGSLNGLESMLDARYKKLFHNPVQVKPYAPTASRSNRVVLAEFFTGAG